MMKKMASFALMTTMIATMTLGTYADETTGSALSTVPTTFVAAPTDQFVPVQNSNQPNQQGRKGNNLQNNNGKQNFKQQQQQLLEQQRLEKIKKQNLKLKLQQQQLQQQKQDQANTQQPILTAKPAIKQRPVQKPTYYTNEPVVAFDFTGMLATTTGSALDAVQNLDTTKVNQMNKKNFQFDQKDKQAMKKMENQFKGLKEFKVVPVDTIVTTAGAIKVNAPLVISDKAVLMPVSVIEKAFGAKVQYIKSEKKYLITKDQVFIEIFVNRAVAEVNGKPIKESAKPVMINNRVLLPINVIAKSLNLKVKYEAKTNTLYITEKAVQPILPIQPVQPYPAPTTLDDGTKAPVSDQIVTP